MKRYEDKMISQPASQIDEQTDDLSHLETLLLDGITKEKRRKSRQVYIFICLISG